MKYSYALLLLVSAMATIPNSLAQNSNTSNNNGQGGGNGVDGNEGNGLGNTVQVPANSTANVLLSDPSPNNSTQTAAASLTVKPVVPTNDSVYKPKKDSYQNTGNAYKSEAQKLEEESTYGKTINVFNFGDEEKGLSYVEGYMKGNGNPNHGKHYDQDDRDDYQEGSDEKNDDNYNGW